MEKIEKKHIGIIMSGNRAWSKERNLKNEEGYKKGLDLFLRIPRWVFENKISYLSVFLLSAENYQNDKLESANFLKLCKDHFLHNLEKFNQQGIKIKFSGQIETLPGDMPEAILEIEKQTQANENGTLILYVNYDGRKEMVEAVKKLFLQGVDIEQIHYGMLKKYCYNGSLPEPEKIIITGGNKSLNNFLTIQASNSKLIFTNKLWPELEKSDVEGFLV